MKVALIMLAPAANFCRHLDHDFNADTDAYRRRRL
jgi:hypothetical protein